MFRDDTSEKLAEALADMIVGDLMQRWPESVPVLLARRMACPGCLMARFMTVHEAAVEHGVEPDLLLDELVAAIRQGASVQAEQAPVPSPLREPAT